MPPVRRSGRAGSGGRSGAPAARGPRAVWGGRSPSSESSQQATPAVMDTYLTIASKRDTRRYAERAIPAEAVDRLLDAGRLAGSARNRQLWRFVVVEEARARRAGGGDGSDASASGRDEDRLGEQAEGRGVRRRPGYRNERRRHGPWSLRSLDSARAAGGSGDAAATRAARRPHSFASAVTVAPTSRRSASLAPRRALGQASRVLGRAAKAQAAAPAARRTQLTTACSEGSVATSGDGLALPLCSGCARGQLRRRRRRTRGRERRGRFGDQVLYVRLPRGDGQNYDRAVDRDLSNSSPRPLPKADGLVNSSFLAA